MSEELKPCPFCGSEAKHNSIEQERINCTNASCYQSEEWREYGHHINEWQSRPLEDALQAKLDVTLYHESIKQTEILTEEVNVWKPAAITKQLEIDALQAKLDVALTDLHDSTAQLVMDNEIIVALQSKLDARQRHRVNSYDEACNRADALQAKLDNAVEAMKITKMRILDKYPITGHSVLKNINNALEKSRR